MTHPNPDYKPRKLEDILVDMVAQARKNPFQPARRRLGRGLHLEVTAEAGSYHLKLWRPRELPSPQEWKTVLAAWPWKTAANGHQVNTPTDRYLHGWIELNTIIQQKLL